MKIPEHLLWDPNMTEEKRKSQEKFVESERERMKKAPTYDTEEEAIRAAVAAVKKDDVLRSVWKEPEDIGNRYAVVELSGLRERAYNSGYTETVKEEKIFKLAKKDIDEIEEL